jgi:hypothetical protein
MTDRIELAEYRPDNDVLEHPLVVRVAGMRHYQGAGHLKEGESVLLEREPHNSYESCATAMLTAGGEKIGYYVPRQYAKLMAALLDAGVLLEAMALRRLTEPADGGRMLVMSRAAGRDGGDSAVDARGLNLVLAAGRLGLGLGLGLGRLGACS